MALSWRRTTAGCGREALRRWSLAACGVIGLWSLAACGDAGKGKTEALVSIDADGAARAATSVRIQVNAAVVELERKSWPLEVLVRASDPSHDTFALRAFGLRHGQVVGAAEKTGTFSRGKRTQLELELEPGADIGALPPVNSEIGPGGLVMQPGELAEAGVGADAQVGTDGGAESEAGSPHGRADAGHHPRDASPEGTSDAAADAEVGADGGMLDAGGADACVPSASDCGGCGISCAAGDQCVDGTCMPKPPQTCTDKSLSGRSYRYCTDKLSWSAARDSCQSANMDLAIIDAPAEQTALVDEAPSGFLSSGAWIGGSDAATCKSGGYDTWYWVNPANGQVQGAPFCAFSSASATSCTPVSSHYTNWASGQPSNACSGINLCGLGVSCSPATSCLGMGSSGSWAGASCSNTRAYVCEQP
jgi:hypothetical protein